MEELFRHEMPEWDRSRFLTEDNDGEEWKLLPQLEAAEKLYEQCREIFRLCRLMGVQMTGLWGEAHRDLIMESICIVGPKIISAETTGLYVTCMENAAVIRYNMGQLRNMLITMDMLDTKAKYYSPHILEEIETFKRLFKVWISFFKKDDWEDEWGLF
ncbi:hypothetical protein [Sphingobacterium pedocola]|uniref:Uncharacterized protein n=1 Tax=Sphingobacterium pedocola TaxID=2082722 RepID=A0ABR9T981_9SPHI|nr:hypothetical protein [Sphingobacterium pedocola]MBE8721192.1 hypothetical protein [Sphingobacterium pedocola]